MLKISSLTAVLLIALYTPKLFAAEETERWFQVEIIVFTNAELETDSPETWPSYLSLETPEQSINISGVTELQAANSEPSDDDDAAQLEQAVFNTDIVNNELNAFAALDDDERQLNAQRLRLERSRTHRILFHEAWNQPVPDRDNIIPIRIDGGEKYGRQAELQGYIDLYVERYLHMKAELNFIEYEKSQDPFSFFAEPNSSFSASETIDAFGGFNLINADSLLSNRVSRQENDFFISTSAATMLENRRMRSREIHYFDNPKFGMIVLITPVVIEDQDNT